MERNIEKIELDEYDIVQNHILGAHIIREFVRYYQNNKKGNSGPTLALVMPILPLVLNKAARSSISKRRYIEGSLVRTILEEKTLYVGLQNRMERMADQTFQSISMAFSLNLLTYNKENTELYIGYKINPASELESASNYKDMLGASKRLGTWFAKLSFEELITVFKISF